MQEIYLVDCENVGAPTIIGNGDYKIYYFVRNKGLVIGGNPLYYEVVYCNHNGCKDAMDFIIDFYLGQLTIKYGLKCTYYIVSNDNGFDNVITTGRELGYNIRRKKFECHILVSNERSGEELFRGMPDRSRVKLLNVYKDFKRSKRFSKDTFTDKVIECLSKYGYSTAESKAIISYLIISGGLSNG